MKVIKPVGLACLVGIMAGCATPRMDTPSGRPEVTIPADKSGVKKAAIEFMLNQHYIITQEFESLWVFESSPGGSVEFWKTNLLTGQRPKYRLRINVIETDDKIRLVAAASLAHAPGISGQETEDEFTDRRTFVDLQWMLDCVAADVAGLARPDRPSNKKNSSSTAAK